ncbi:hypothetical protein KIW84_030211 [Lathyrus oleraceus]|uniref:Uncharacterized protein n=1 Tax=Pisum sativum TaxID=3888 RepID=A0A9D5AZ08_PEA|nr:hypothetical protein KIW84_030211 [Pisum sativum]
MSEIKKDADAYDFVAYACATQDDEGIFMEHDVKDIEVEARVPKCVNGVTYMEGIYDEVIEGLDDSEDDRATALVDEFDGGDVVVPINHRDIVA